jgi:hypothetical protein
MTFRMAIKGLRLHFLPSVSPVVRGGQSDWQGPCLLAAAMNHGGRGEGASTKRRRPSCNRLVLKFSGNPTRPARRRLLRVLREHRVLRDSWIDPAHANGAIFPVNMHQTLNARCNSYYGLTLGPLLAVAGNASNDHFPSGRADSDGHLGKMRTAELRGPARGSIKSMAEVIL